jgi:osmotically-inducible protein OsmY
LRIEHRADKDDQMSFKTAAKMALIGALLMGASAAYAADNEADWSTTLSVKLELLEKLGTDSLHVEVDATAGALTLKGTVEKRETRELAETIAKSVKAVKSVDNQILLAASVADPNKAGVAVGEGEAELKDATLETKIRLALLDKYGANGFNVATKVASGVVTLQFAADFPAKKRSDARRMVGNLSGVTKVVSVDKT